MFGQKTASRQSPPIGVAQGLVFSRRGLYERDAGPYPVFAFLPRFCPEPFPCFPPPNPGFRCPPPLNLPATQTLRLSLVSLLEILPERVRSSAVRPLPSALFVMQNRPYVPGFRRVFLLFDSPKGGGRRDSAPPMVPKGSACSPSKTRRWISQEGPHPPVEIFPFPFRFFFPTNRRDFVFRPPAIVNADRFLRRLPPVPGSLDPSRSGVASWTAEVRRAAAYAPPFFWAPPSVGEGEPSLYKTWARGQG